jgi:hypothetical protein
LRTLNRFIHTPHSNFPSLPLNKKCARFSLRSWTLASWRKHFQAQIPHGECSPKQKNIFTPYSTLQIMIWWIFHEELASGAAHRSHLAASRAATPLFNEFATLAIQYPPTTQAVQSCYNESVK